MRVRSAWCGRSRAERLGWPRSGRKRVEGRTGGLSGVGRLGAISRFAGDGRRLGARLGALWCLRASVTRAALSGGGEGPADCFASFYKSWGGAKLDLA